uniref:Uncharacterized protein n=1 Tax=Avena sativa TaxID=4498 RepID=A0ACD5W5H4_AVESA
MEREAKKKRYQSPSPSGEVHPPLCQRDDRAALQHARPEMRGGGDDQDESVTETNGARVDEMTKVGGAVEELSSFAPKSSISRPYIPDEPVTETNGARVDEMAKAGGAVEELSSFTPKSPISRPYMPDELNDPIAYPEILAAFNEAHDKYEAKLGRRGHLFTLAHKNKIAPSCLFHHAHLHQIRESAKKAVLHAAKSVIRLSSSVDGKPLANCCGLWIKWNKESKEGIILTTAHLIRTKQPTINHWEGRDEYNINANVMVHLLDDTTKKGHYLYHQGHYDLAFFEVRVDEPVQSPSFIGNVHCGQDVFLLGRDNRMNLRITHGRVEYWNHGSDERHHYMYLSHQKDDYPSRKNDGFLLHQNNDDHLCDCDDNGGSIIDLKGNVVGLVNKHLNKSFVPSCILDKCVDLWLEFRCIPRLHLGMKFTSIKLLDPVHVEKMWRMYKIEDGLIVEEVSEESHAEKLGICLGDVIERFNGECISTTIELENMLLSRCRDHFDQGNHLNVDIDVSIQVFHMEERLRRTVNLTVNVSDGGEIVIRRTCPITEGTSTSVQFIQHVADDPSLPRPELTWEELGRRYCD